MTTTPNTDAELTAYNFGVHCAAVDSTLIGETPGVNDWHTLTLTPAQRSARELLTPEVFWLWVDRGYDAAAGVVSANASP